MQLSPVIQADSFNRRGIQTEFVAVSTSNVLLREAEKGELALFDEHAGSVTKLRIIPRTGTNRNHRWTQMHTDKTGTADRIHG